MRRFSHGKFRSSGLRVAILARRFDLRQGLWIEDLQTPPEQECSNGSLILLAVVLWRTFFCWAAATKWAVHSAMKLLKVKTVRFVQVIEKCGEPEVYTLWQRPGADRHFQSQIKNNR